MRLAVCSLVLLLPAAASCGSESDAGPSNGGSSTTSGGAVASGGRGGAPSGNGGNANAGALNGGAAPANGGAANGGAANGGAANGGAANGGAANGGAAPANGGAVPSAGASADPEGGSPANEGGSRDGGTDTGGGGGMPPTLSEPAPGDYGKRASLPAANSEMAVAELEGKIYLLGGYPTSPAETQTVVPVYDSSTDAWDFAAELPIALHHPVAVGALGKVYSLGGQLQSGETDRTLVYDPDLDEWNDLTPMPTARGGGAAALIDDKIYVVGGRPPAENQFEAYDIGDDEWTVLADLPHTFAGRNHLIATAIDGKVYVAGGRYDGGGFNSPMTKSLDVYDPVTGMWSRLADMPRERGGLNGVAANGCFFTWGGEGADIGEPNNVFPDHDVYDPETDTWTKLPDLPTPVHGVTGAAFIDGLIYMPGGGLRQGGGSGTTLFQVYRPEKTCL